MKVDLDRRLSYLGARIARGIIHIVPLDWPYAAMTPPGVNPDVLGYLDTFRGAEYYELVVRARSDLEKWPRPAIMQIQSIAFPSSHSLSARVEQKLKGKRQEQF